LQGHGVFPEVEAFFFLELVGQPIDDGMVEVISAKVSVTIGRFYFEDTFAELEDRDVESSAA